MRYITFSLIFVFSIIFTSKSFGNNNNGYDANKFCDTLFVQFEPGGLNIEISGIQSLEDFTGSLYLWEDDSISILKIILIPYYCLHEKTSNEFIGVQRAKIILDQLVVTKLIKRENISIRDLGPLDVEVKSCNGREVLIPAVEINRCNAGVLIITE